MNELVDAMQREQRRDVCPSCGSRRVELVVAPGRFYCESCGVAGPGPNEEQPAGAQGELEIPDFVRRAIAAQGKIDPELVARKAAELEGGPELTPEQQQLFDSPPARHWQERD